MFESPQFGCEDLFFERKQVWTVEEAKKQEWLEAGCESGWHLGLVVVFWIPRRLTGYVNPTVWWFRNPAFTSWGGSLSHYLHGLTGFLPSTARPRIFRCTDDIPHFVIMILLSSDTPPKIKIETEAMMVWFRWFSFSNRCMLRCI